MVVRCVASCRVVSHRELNPFRGCWSPARPPRKRMEGRSAAAAEQQQRGSRTATRQQAKAREVRGAFLADTANGGGGRRTGQGSVAFSAARDGGLADGVLLASLSFKVGSVGPAVAYGPAVGMRAQRGRRCCFLVRSVFVARNFVSCLFSFFLIVPPYFMFAFSSKKKKVGGYLEGRARPLLRGSWSRWSGRA